MTLKRERCRQCGELQYLSQRGLCPSCAESNVTKTVEALRNKKGAVYQRWKKNITRAVKGK